MAAPLSERFERSVDRSGMHHLWLGATNPARGTGRLKVDGRDVTAHRVAWELAHGALGPGGRVLPCRDEPRCVRIEHLRLDAVARVRSTRAARGTGSKRQRRPGVWELTVTVATDGLGGTRRVFRTFNGGQRDASRALAELVAEVGDGSDLPSEESKGLTFEGVLDQFLDHLRDNKGRRHSTLVRYRGLADRWIVPAIGSTIAERLRPARARGPSRPHADRRTEPEFDPPGVHASQRSLQVGAPVPADLPEPDGRRRGATKRPGKARSRSA